MFQVDIPVSGSGSKNVHVPRGYKFMLLENPTGYAVNVYSDLVNQDVQHRIAYCSIYTIMPVLLPNQGNTEQDLNIVYTGSGIDKISVKFTEENPGIGQTLISPGGSSSVIVAGDGVGLAKSTQFPIAPSGEGGLKVTVLSTPALEAGQLNRDASNNIGVNVENPITVSDGGNVALGSTADAMVTDPVNSGTLTGLFKGLLYNLGLTSDAAVTNPASTGSLLSFIKGLVTSSGQTSDAAVSSPSSAGSMIALLKGVMSNIINLPQAASAGINTAPSRVSVGAGATIIFNGVVTGDQLIIRNLDNSNTLFIGGSSVSIVTGFPILAGETFILDVKSGSSITIYGIATATLPVAVLILN